MPFSIIIEEGIFLLSQIAVLNGINDKIDSKCIPLNLILSEYKLNSEFVMNDQIKSIKVQFDLHTRLYNNVLRDISDQDADSRLSETVNHIKWLAGHLMSTRM